MSTCHVLTWRCHQLVKVKKEVEVLRAALCLPQEKSPALHQQDSLIQCGISQSPANCSINRVGAPNTHTHTKTQLAVTAYWTLVPVAKVTLPKSKSEPTALMRPHGTSEVHVWMHKRSGSLKRASLLMKSTMCVWQHSLTPQGFFFLALDLHVFCKMIIVQLNNFKHLVVRRKLHNNKNYTKIMQRLTKMKYSVFNRQPCLLFEKLGITCCSSFTFLKNLL